MTRNPLGSASNPGSGKPWSPTDMVLGWDRTLVVAAVLILGLMAPTVLALVVDGRTLNGISVWIKPLKFQLSVGLYLLTLAWLFGALGKAQAFAGKALYHSIRGAFFLEQAEHHLHGATHLGVRVDDDAAFFVVGVAHRQRRPQLTLAGLVQLAALEAPAQEMQLGLCHRALQSEQQAVVEVGRVVAAVGVDHQCVGQGAKLQQAKPVHVRARQA